jgi:hypothetical protein
MYFSTIIKKDKKINKINCSTKEQFDRVKGDLWDGRKYLPACL